MERIELRKVHRELFNAKPEPQFLDVPELNYLAISGKGEPGGEEFQGAIGALYGLAYTMKFQCKSGGRDFAVMALEGDYCWKEGQQGSMEWTLMIMVPDFIGEGELERAVRELQQKKGDNPYLNQVRSMRRLDGQCVHMLHVGPYDQEKDSIDRIMRFIAEKGLRPNGPHHEIYISDPNRTAPDKLKTIIRYPVREIKP